MILMLTYITSFYIWIYIWRNDPWMGIVGSDIFSLFGVFIASICLYHVYKKTMGDERIFWFLLFLSCLSYFIAEVNWDYYELILKVNAPFPGLPDVFYILQPIFILLSILYLKLKTENVFIGVRLFLDILITMDVAAALSWYYLIQPIFAQEHITFLFKAVSVAYPIADLGLLFGILSLIFTVRTFLRGFQYTFLVIGLSLFTFADSVYLYLNASEGYQSGGFVDPLWILGLFCIALAGIYSLSRSPKTQQNVTKIDRDPMLVVNYKSIAMPYISLFVLLIVTSTRMDSIILGFIFGIVLISIRQIFNLLDNKHLLFLLSQSNQELEINKIILEEKQEYLRNSSDSMKIEARTDFLTGLYNRRYIIERVEGLSKQAKLHKLAFSLFMLDIDHFKQINDRFGHEAGDALLQQIAQLLRKNTRFEETIGRFGGDEFIAFLPEVGAEEAEMIADRFRKQIAAHIFGICSQNVKVTVSIGVSQWDARDTDDGQSLIARIDKALYKAKDKSRNCTVVL